MLSQGLHASGPFGSGKDAVERCIERIGYVQIDTISVIRRSHDHTLWCRVPSYAQHHLDALQREGRVFEYWTHAAAYVPMSHYRFCLPYMHAIASGQKHWRRPDKKAMRAVLDRVRAEGPLRARDFDDSRSRDDHWGWNWKPAKIALEQLFIEGKLIACRREGFQKVYDLPERALPAALDTRMPSEREFLDHLISSAILAHGLVTEREVTYLRKGTLLGARTRIQERLEMGDLLQISVSGVPQTYYTTSSTLEALAARRITANVHLLSPFDNLVVQRKRIRQLFGSDYQLECFVPAAKRQFGYYCLPILYGTDIVGRLDPTADRKTKTLVIKALHIEAPIRDASRFAKKLARRLQRVAAFNQCERVRIVPRADNALSKLVAASLTA